MQTSETQVSVPVLNQDALYQTFEKQLNERDLNQNVNKVLGRLAEFDDFLAKMKQSFDIMRDRFLQ